MGQIGISVGNGESFTMSNFRVKLMKSGSRNVDIRKRKVGYVDRIAVLSKCYQVTLQKGDL